MSTHDIPSLHLEIPVLCFDLEAGQIDTHMRAYARRNEIANTWRTRIEVISGAAGYRKNVAGYQKNVAVF